MKTLKLPKTLKLNYKTWRCGIYSLNALGTGTTKLRNELGYECCLGQFAKQAGAKNSDINGCSLPSDLYIHISSLNKINNKPKYTVDTIFSKKAANINDDENYTTPIRVYKLINLCKKYDRKLVLVNFPQKIKREISNMMRKKKNATHTCRN